MSVRDVAASVLYLLGAVCLVAAGALVALPLGLAVLAFVLVALGIVVERGDVMTEGDD